jgi:hypothetical protein
MRIINSVSLFVCGLIFVVSCAVHDKKRSSIAAQISVEVDKTEIDSGDSLTLTWKSTNADRCTRSSGGIKQDVPVSGNETVSPTVDVNFAFECSSVNGGQPASGSVDVKVFPLPTGTLKAAVAQIMLGESVSLDWDCKNADKADLSANGQQIPKTLTLKGADEYRPESDTTYELTCTNKRGKNSGSKTTVSVLSETSVSVAFTSLPALDAVIDISDMKTDCGQGCRYAPYQPESFQPYDNGAYIASPDYRQAIEKGLKPLDTKVALLTSKTVSFDFSRTIGYGHRAALDDAVQKTRCEQTFPYGEKDAIFANQPELLDEIERNTERLSSQNIDGPVGYDIEVSSKALRGVLRAGTEATMSYKIGHLKVQPRADYTDFDRAKGSYRIHKDGTVVRGEEENMQMLRRLKTLDFSSDLSVEVFETRAAGCSVPGGWNGKVEVTKPQGVSWANFFPAPDTIGYLGNPNMYNPKAELCYLDAYYKEGGSVSAGEPCWYTQAKGLDERPGYVKPRSPRAIQGLGIVQCKKYFPTLADTYGLKDDWTTSAEMQYFVTDGSFKSGCDGTSCVKEERMSENDWRFQEVEPAKNRCVDRWTGLSWNDYQSRLSAACTSTQLYKDAVAKQVAKANDQNFANACNADKTCGDALKAMAGLAQKFSPQALSDIIEREATAMQKAKTESRPYFITEDKLSPSFIAEARTQLSQIEAGLETVQSLHAAKDSRWISANLIVHSNQSVPGFDSYQESKNSISAYKKQLDRVNGLTDIDLRVISCGYESKGRFRKYEQPKILGNVTLEFDRQNTVKTKVKADTKMPN